jgi:uncharacterized membrane protein
MYRHSLLAVVVTLSVLVGGREVVEAASFTFTTIDVPGSSFTVASGINPRGQIVGFYPDNIPPKRHGFLYDAGAFTTIDVPGAIETLPFAINPRGQIVGVYNDSSGTHGFLYDAGAFTTIDVPGSSFTVASGINPRGQIVGEYFDGIGLHGFLATPK